MTDADLRLGVNIDHVATVRNAWWHPSTRSGGTAAGPARTASQRTFARTGAIFGTRISTLSRTPSTAAQFRMAATEEMVAIACDVKPNAACIVPERREESNRGVAVAGREAALEPLFSESGIRYRLSLFIEASEAEIRAAAAAGADIIELHTGVPPR